MTLLEDSSNLIPNQDELNINRTLPELQHAAARLAAKGSRGPQAQAEAAVYFASRGFDLNRHTKALKQIRFLPSRRTEPLKELDVEKYLDQNRRTCIVDTIRESQAMLQRHFRESYETRLQSDWESSKDQILQHLGTISSVNSTSAQLALPPSKRPYQPRALEPVKQRYAEATKQFVEAIKKQSGNFRPACKYQTVQQTLQAFTGAEAAETESFVDIWRTLGFMVGERKLDTSGEARSDKNLHAAYRIDYEKQDPKLQFELVHHAKAALEFQYGEYIRNEIEGSKNKGGKPGLENDVHTYVYQLFREGTNPNVQVSSFSKFDQLPVYAVMYYCIRCGCLQGALRAAKVAKNELLVRAIEALIHNRFASLPNDIWNALCLQYNRQVKNRSQDVYEIAIYCIIARADPKPEADLREIQSTIEDYLWIRLNMIVDPSEDLPNFLPYGSGDPVADIFSRITLEDLIERIMQNRMSLLQEEANERFYFSNILLLLQKFELCVDHLKNNGLLVEAAHVALVLNWYGLLRSGGDASAKGVNLGKLISKIVSQVALVDCDLAFYYFYLLLETRKGQHNFTEAIVEHLSQKSVDLSLVVGTMSKRQVNLDGSMPKFFRHSDVFSICSAAGALAEKEGSYNHAMNLYTLGGKFDKAGTMLVRLVARVLSKPSGTPQKKEYLSLAQRFWNHYQYHLATHPAGTNLVEAMKSEVNTDLFVVMKLAEAFELKQKGPKYYDRALHIIDNVQILPPPTTEDRPKVSPEELEQRLEIMKSRGDAVRALFSPICDLMLEILLYQAKELKKVLRDFQDSDSEAKMKQIQGRAKSLTSYLGRIQTHLDVDQDLTTKLSHLTNEAL